jgi:hypothetical protein
MRRKVAEVAEVAAEEAHAEGAAVRSGREGLFWGVKSRGDIESMRWRSRRGSGLRKVAEVAEVAAEEALAEGAAVRGGRGGLFWGVKSRWG